MRRTKVYSACVVLGATLIGAWWLYTYRTWEVLQYVDLNGHRFHASERVMTQPWWSVYATVALILFGTGITLWLLPGCRRMIERLLGHLVKTPTRA